MFTEEQLETFDRLTDEASSYDQLTRIRARLEYRKWSEKEGITDEIAHAMKDELVLRGKW